MIAILKVARELRLYKDTYRILKQDENYPDDSKVQDDQAPIYSGYMQVPKRKRQNYCESVASLIDHSNLGSRVKMEFPDQLSPVDDLTSHEGGVLRRPNNNLFENGNLVGSENQYSEDEEQSKNDEDPMVYCKCGHRYCHIGAPKSIAKLIACPKANCTSGMLIFKNCKSKECRRCYLTKFYPKPSQSSSSNWAD
jgi:hypothetical protein